ncbi:MAG TPA: hypothetical protein VFA67_07145 [Candidatus Sulfotelmatobacter sp.]|nr:hypothetical protein [Candidatus Sulfotelmatobacter sp.]
MSSRRLVLLSAVTLLLSVPVFAADKKPLPPPPAPAKLASPGVTDEFVRKQFGDSCSLLPGLPQLSGDLDGDGIDDLVVAAKCKNPMADRDEYGFVVADPFDAFMGFGDVKVTSTFASDVPERRGVTMLIIHGAEKDGWQAEKPKAKFLLINLPFKALSVKRYSLKKRTVLGIYLEEQGAGESTSSVVYWDGKKYRYVPLGGTME